MSHRHKAKHQAASRTSHQSASRTSPEALVAPDQRSEVEVDQEIAEAAESEPAEVAVEETPDLEDFAPTPTVHDIELQPTFTVTTVTLDVPTVRHTNRRPCRYPTVKLTPQAADDLHALFLGLQRQGATVGGRPVERHPDALRWLLEQAVR